ncbi:MAG: low molecular weight protein-tyrosine-phosphatase [Nocardioidaceae bacterium]
MILVCLGNICRSPMAEVVLTQALKEAGLDGRVAVRSAGTGDWHLGEGMDVRAQAALADRGYDPSRHRARHLEADWFAEDDLILVMDSANLRDVTSTAPTSADRSRIRMFRASDPDAVGDLDLPDPWYGGQDAFEQVLDTLERTADALVEQLRLTIDSA